MLREIRFDFNNLAFTILYFDEFCDYCMGMQQRFLLIFITYYWHHTKMFVVLKVEKVRIIAFTSLKMFSKINPLYIRKNINNLVNFPFHLIEDTFF